MEALHERADCLRMRLDPVLKDAQSLELAMIAALGDSEPATRFGDLAVALSNAMNQATAAVHAFDAAIDCRVEQAEAAAREICAEVSLSALVVHCAAFEDAAMRSGNVVRRNEAAGARNSAEIIETWKRLPDELKPWYCAKETPDQLRAGLVRRGIDVDALEAEG